MQFNNFKKNSAILAGGAVAGQIIQALSTPFLARSYDPIAFGAWAVLLSAAAIPAAVGGLRYELGILLSRGKEEDLNILALQSLCNLTVTALTAAVVLLLGPALSRLLKWPASLTWLLLIPVIVSLTGIINLLSNWLTKTAQFRGLAQLRLAQSGTTVGVQLLSAPLSQHSFLGLAFGGILGFVAPILVAIRPLLSRYGLEEVRRVSVSRLINTARKYSKFPKYVVPYGFVGVARERGLIMLLASFATLRTVGLYSLALRLAYMPVSLVSAAVSPIVYQRAAADSDPKRVGPFIGTVLKTLIDFATPAFVLVAAFASTVFGIIGGARWADAGIFAAILAAPACTQLYAGVLDRMMDLVSKQRVALTLEIIYTAVALAGLASCLSMHRIVLAILLFALVTVCYHVAWIITVHLVFGLDLFRLYQLGVRLVVLAALCAAVFVSLSMFIGGVQGFVASALLLLAYYSVQVKSVCGFRGSKEVNVGT